MANNPINYMDRDGQKIVDANGRVVLDYDGDKLVWNGEIPEYYKQIQPILERLWADDVLRKGIRELIDSPTEYVLQMSFGESSSKFDPWTKDKNWPKSHNGEEFTKTRIVNGKKYFSKVTVSLSYDKFNPVLEKLEKELKKNNAADFSFEDKLRMARVILTEALHGRPDAVNVEEKGVPKLGSEDYFKVYNEPANESIKMGIQYFDKHGIQKDWNFIMKPFLAENQRIVSKGVEPKKELELNDEGKYVPEEYRSMPNSVSPGTEK